jgi:hypothetical protein
MSSRTIATAVLALICASAATVASAQSTTQATASATTSAVDTVAAHTKLLELGYPPEPERAVSRWRGDTGRNGKGPMTASEASAIMEQPLPKYFAAIAGNPFQGMGVGIKHTDRWSAEAQAVLICKQRGGGKACDSTYIAAGKQCVFIAGYKLPAGDRRRSHGNFVIGTGGIAFVRAKALEGCRKAATLPGKCRPILSFCADGSDFHEFESGGA